MDSWTKDSTHNLSKRNKIESQIREVYNENKT